MLLFPMELVVVITREVKANLLLMNMVVRSVVMFLGFYNKISPTMRRSQLIRSNIGVIRRKKKLRKRNLRMTFN